MAPKGNPGFKPGKRAKKHGAAGGRKSSRKGVKNKPKTQK